MIFFKKRGKEKYKIEGSDGNFVTIEMKKEGEPFNPQTIEEALNFKTFTDEMFFWFLENVELVSIALKGIALKLIVQDKKIIKRQLKNKLPEKVEDKVLSKQKS